jgi:hypothetical protein
MRALENRRIMEERERRVTTQLQEKVLKKQAEVAEQRASAELRIQVRTHPLAIMITCSSCNNLAHHYFE